MVSRVLLHLRFPQVSHLYILLHNPVCIPVASQALSRRDSPQCSRQVHQRGSRVVFPQSHRHQDRLQILLDSRVHNPPINPVLCHRASRQEFPPISPVASLLGNPHHIQAPSPRVSLPVRLPPSPLRTRQRGPSTRSARLLLRHAVRRYPSCRPGPISCKMPWSTSEKGTPV